MTVYRIQIKTWDNRNGDGIKTVERELTEAEALHVAASVADPESPVCAIDEQVSQ
jgi:hypothetical protein